MEAGKIERKGGAPKLRFKDFKGWWQVKQLGELLEFKNGINASKEQYGKGIKFINVLDILSNEFITYDLILGSVEVDENVASKYLVKYGDILFQRSSETREEVGTACVYLDPNRTAVFGGFVIRGRKIGEYDPVFMNKLLKTSISRNEITSKSGGSTRYNVGQETLASVRLNFPTIPEQQKIASFFSAVDQKIQQLTRKKELLEQYKKGVMQQLFSGKLRFKDENGKAFPKWEERIYGEIYSFLSTNSLSRENLNYESGHVKNIHYGDIHTKFNSLFHVAEEKIPYINAQMDISKIREESYVKQGDLVIADASEDYDDIGKCIEIVNLNKEKVVAGLHTFLARPDKHKIYIGFSGHLAKAGYVRVQIKKIAQGTKVLSLSTGRLAQVKLQIPCFEEQKKIANYLSDIDSKIKNANKQITQTQSFKKGLLQQMFV